jgi:anti-sigma regulatory factor (Ser/Thr protein kinase)
VTSASAVDEVEEFSHEAFLYSSLPEFLDEVCGFVREGLERNESVLLATGGERLTALRSLFDREPDVQLADMLEIGTNPARIIPVWRDFLEEHVAAGRPVRGLGEPIWAGRTEAELAECHQHESLLNLAFEGGPAWRLLCPYDVSALPADVIEEARANHPVVLDDGHWSRSDRFRAERPLRALRHRPLPAPGGNPTELAFTTGDLAAVRRLVESRCSELGVSAAAADDLVLCVDEIAANSLLHGGGAGVLRVWNESSTLICEVADTGVIVDPLVGRQSPSPERAGGRGVWLANQLCDLVQIRSGASGTVVRLHVSLG